MAVHRSSQTSAPITRSSTSVAQKSRSVPNGTVCPLSVTTRLTAAEPRRKHLGHDAQNPAAVNGDSAVEELVVHDKRHADEGDAAEQLLGGAGDLAEGRYRAGLQRLLLEEVGAGVAGQAKLGEDENCHAFALSLLHQLHDLLRVVNAVSHLQLR